MEYYNNILCISHGELTGGLMTNSQYVWYSRENKLKPVRRACRGTCALYSVESLPPKYRDMAKELYGVPDRETAGDLLSLVQTDSAALKFYHEYRYANGSGIEPAMQIKYAGNAAILNAISHFLQTHKTARARHGDRMLPGRELFAKISGALPRISEQWDNSLPEYPRNLELKYRQYMTEGYSSLVKQTSRDYKHALVVSPIIERMILSIYAMKNKPFAKSVHEIYIMFLCGQIEIIDASTGELFNRADFYKNGMMVTISESTVRNWINKPKNRRLVDKYRNDGLYNKAVHEPYEERANPVYSLSKISMDDRDLTRKIILKKLYEENEKGYVDWITVSSSLMFSMKYATNYEQFAKQTLYCKPRLSDYSADGYLDSLEIVRTDYRNLCRQYRDSQKTLFIADPPYLSTDVKTYNAVEYWTLKDYLNVLTELNGLNFIYFTSEKSQIVELCQWLDGNEGKVRNIFKGVSVSTVKSPTSGTSSYTDIMLYKLNLK